VLFVVLLAIILLVYFDVISFDTSSCELSNEIKCLYYEYHGGVLTLELENTFEEALLGVDITVDGCAESLKGVSLSGGGTETFEFGSCQFAEQFKTTINLTYVDNRGKRQVVLGEVVERTNLFKITT